MLIESLTLGGAATALAFGAYHPNCPLFGAVVARGDSRSRKLHLTFDDGPDPRATDWILETLDAFRVPAAFFMVGDHVRRYPRAARRVAEMGHEIGNHTDAHLKLHLRGPRVIRQQITDAHRSIVEATGRAPRAFRAPHGYRNPFVEPVVRELGYTVFGWTFGVFDTARPGVEEIRRRVRKRLRPGAIILLHDGDGALPAGDRTQTAAAVMGIIKDALAAGYSFAPLPTAV